MSPALLRYLHAVAEDAPKEVIERFAYELPVEERRLAADHLIDILLVAKTTGINLVMKRLNAARDAAERRQG